MDLILWLIHCATYRTLLPSPSFNLFSPLPLSFSPPTTHTCTLHTTYQTPARPYHLNHLPPTTDHRPSTQTPTYHLPPRNSTNSQPIPLRAPSTTSYNPHTARKRETAIHSSCILQNILCPSVNLSVPRISNPVQLLLSCSSIPSETHRRPPTDYR